MCETNANCCPQKVPVVPMHLEYPEESEEHPEECGSGPTPSGSAKTATSAKSSEKKSGQHGRHKIHSKVRVIRKIGPHGEPLEPEQVIGIFSNQCSCIFRQHVPITYSDWRKVQADLKGVVWGEMKRRFIYPEDQFDEDLCKRHVLFIAGKALRNLRSHLNRQYVQEGKTPYKEYSFITREVWEEFVEKISTNEAKAKGQDYSELAKKNVLPHHLGMTGYATKEEEGIDSDQCCQATGEVQTSWSA